MMEGTHLNSTRYTRAFLVREVPMNGLIYLVGLVVVIMAVLSFLGMH
jgi:hypothetical protein